MSDTCIAPDREDHNAPDWMRLTVKIHAPDNSGYMHPAHKARAIVCHFADHDAVYPSTRQAALELGVPEGAIYNAIQRRRRREPCYCLTDNGIFEPELLDKAGGKEYV